MSERLHPGPELKSLSQSAADVSVSDVVLMTLHAFSGQTAGKTLLQKRIYFVGVLTGILPELGYGPHFYGPYSAQVANAVGSLCALGFVRETEANRGDHAGFGNTRYNFALTPDGKEVTLPEPQDIDGMALYQRIKGAVAQIKAAGDPDYVALSIAAKTHLLLEKSGGSATSEAIAGLAKQFNWQITEEQVTKAADFLVKLNLVSVSTP